MFNVTANGLSLSGVDAQGVDWMTTDVQGWGPTASTASQTRRPQGSGAWSTGKFSAPRAVTVYGTLRAPSPALAQDALDRLAVAVSLSDFRLEVTEAAATRWAPVFQTGEILPRWVSPYEVDWSFQVASDDWRRFGEQVTASTSLPSEVGGLTVPFTVPFTVPGQTNTGEASITNPGNEAGPVVLRIDGPCAGPVITHLGTGRVLAFAPDLMIGEGEHLLIDTEARSARANGQASRSGWITSRGWSEFVPGLNTWSFAASSYSPTARLTVSAVPSWR